MKLLAIMILVLAAAAAQARLGETKVEIQKRYGPPSDPLATGTNAGYPVLTYQFKDYFVMVTFRTNTSVFETVRPKLIRQMSDEECKNLMEAVSSQTEWLVSGFDSKDVKSWENKAGYSAIRVRTGDQDMLMITTKEFLGYRQQYDPNAQERRNVDGPKKTDGF